MRGHRLLLCLAGALLVALLSLPAGATAATGGISGTVTGAGAGPLKEDRVCARSDSSSFASNCAYTNLNGEYSIANLAEGGYRVDFEGSGEFIGQWFAGVESEEESTDVAVVAGATTPHIDATLTKGAAVEGTITDATSHAGLANIRACTSAGEGNPFGSHCATSDANGHYRIVGIPSGEYKLRLEPEFLTGDPDYLTQFWPDGQTFAAGTAFSLTDGSTRTGVDAQMRLGGSISGKVLNENGEPVKGLSVCTYPVLGNTNFSYCIENSGETATDGTYRIRGLYSGEYKLHFYGSNGNYLTQWYPDEPTRAGATVVTVTAPAVVGGIDATLQNGGVISGTVTDAVTHAPVPYLTVCARVVGSHASRCSQAKENGGYRIESLPSGVYLAEFGSQFAGSGGAYLRRFYGGSTEESATHIPVTAGHEVDGIDGEVEEGGTISGRVTDAVTHEPAFGIEACAFAGGAAVGRCDTTNAEGEYKIVRLPAGPYAVKFVPAGGGPEENYRIGNKHYVDEFYEAATSEAGATPVPSGPGMAVTGIDVEMHEGGGISGTIDGPLGQPLRDGTACIVEAEEDLGSHCAGTNVNGEYEIAGLAPGPYNVRFLETGAPELASQYFDGVEDFGQAATVTVIGTAVTPDIDARLIPGGAIEGTVIDAYDGSPIAGAWVCAEGTAGASGNCTESGPDGNYAMEVNPGSYRVKFSLGYEEFETEVAEFVTQYFSGAGEPSAATTVTIGSGVTRAGIDAALDPAAGRLDTVSVTKAGKGSGAIVSSPAGIDCGLGCTDTFETRKTVTLTPEPAPGSVFAGWTGACSGTEPCRIRLTGEAQAAATFEPIAETKTVTPAPPATEPAAPGPPPRPTKCKKGYVRKGVGSAARCKKAPKKHRHPHRHPHRHH